MINHAHNSDASSDFVQEIEVGMEIGMEINTGISTGIEIDDVMGKNEETNEKMEMNKVVIDGREMMEAMNEGEDGGSVIELTLEMKEKEIEIDYGDNAVVSIINIATNSAQSLPAPPMVPSTLPAFRSALSFGDSYVPAKNVLEGYRAEQISRPLNPFDQLCKSIGMTVTDSVDPEGVSTFVNSANPIQAPSSSQPTPTVTSRTLFLSTFAPPHVHAPAAAQTVHCVPPMAVINAAATPTAQGHSLATMSSTGCFPSSSSSSPSSSFPYNFPDPHNHTIQHSIGSSSTVIQLPSSLLTAPSPALQQIDATPTPTPILSFEYSSTLLSTPYIKQEVMTSSRKNSSERLDPFQPLIALNATNTNITTTTTTAAAATEYGSGSGSHRGAVSLVLPHLSATFSTSSSSSCPTPACSFLLPGALSSDEEDNDTNDDYYNDDVYNVPLDESQSSVPSVPSDGSGKGEEVVRDGNVSYDGATVTSDSFAELDVQAKGEGKGKGKGMVTGQVVTTDGVDYQGSKSICAALSVRTCGWDGMKRDSFPLYPPLKSSCSPHSFYTSVGDDDLTQHILVDNTETSTHTHITEIVCTGNSKEFSHYRYDPYNAVDDVKIKQGNAGSSSSSSSGNTYDTSSMLWCQSTNPWDPSPLDHPLSVSVPPYVMDFDRDKKTDREGSLGKDTSMGHAEDKDSQVMDITREKGQFKETKKAKRQDKDMKKEVRQVKQTESRIESKKSIVKSTKQEQGQKQGQGRGKGKSQHSPRCCVCLKTSKIEDDDDDSDSDDDSDDDDNPLLYCMGKCGMCVHCHCYGLKKPPKDFFWCESCTEISRPKETLTVSDDENDSAFDRKEKMVTKPKCVLCKKSSGMMKKSKCGQWTHLVCVLFTGTAPSLSTLSALAPYHRNE